MGPIHEGAAWGVVRRPPKEKRLEHTDHQRASVSATARHNAAAETSVAVRSAAQAIVDRDPQAGLGNRRDSDARSGRCIGAVKRGEESGGRFSQITRPRKRVVAGNMPKADQPLVRVPVVRVDP